MVKATSLPLYVREIHGTNCIGSDWVPGSLFTFENLSVFLLVKGKYQIPSKIQTKYPRVFLVFRGLSKQTMKWYLD